jgi:hypothetical protein
MLPRVEIPKDTNKLKQQITALKYQLQHDTTEKDIRIHKAALKSLNEELLFREYLDMQSEEFNANVKGYEKLIMQGKDVAIKVNFTSFWLRVYRTKSNGIEWY